MRRRWPAGTAFAFDFGVARREWRGPSIEVSLPDRLVASPSMRIEDRAHHRSLLSARELDARDPAPARDAFDLPSRGGKPLIYLAGHSLGPMPRDARDAIEAELDAWSALGVYGWWRERKPGLTAAERLAESTALVVGARTDEVVTMNALTVNLHLLWASFYRPTADRYAIVMEESAFPSDRYAVGGQLLTRGLDPSVAVLRVGPRPGEDLLRTEDVEAVLEREGARIALVWLPGIQYRTGQRLDIERITAAAHRVGALAG